MSEHELQPDVGEVLQEEAPEEYQAIPVRVEEVRAPVRVQLLPRKAASTMTRRLTTAPAQILRADPRRARAVLVSDAPFLFAFSEASCQAPTAMAFWPADTPLEITATVDVWALVGAGADDLSVFTEHWAVGQ